MKILDIKENAIKLNLSLSNSMFSFKEMTTSIIKVDIDDGKNVTFSQSNNDGTHNFILFSQKSGEIGVQKLIKKFPLEQNLNNGTNELTPIGQIGMLKNGIEISKYKSEPL